jgi:hypothetical protein
MPAIPAAHRQEDLEFKANQGKLSETLSQNSNKATEMWLKQ